MFTALFDLNTQMTAASSILLMLLAALCGLIIAATALLTGPTSRNFAISLVLLPMLIQVVILMVNGDVGTGVAVLGAFSLIRFRSAPGNARDITLVFLAMAVGLATGMAFAGYALVFTLIACAILLLLSRISLPRQLSPLSLRIQIPEDLDETGLFDDLLSKFTRTCRLEGIRSLHMGSCFELSYTVTLKDADPKPFLDALRVRNGNLPVSLGHAQAQESL